MLYEEIDRDMFCLCCLGLIYTYAKTDNFTEIKLFKKKSISEELETALEDNQLENFLFHSGENAICVYEGITSFEIKAHTFAIYKETVEKDIIFENILFIERDTGDIYTWGGEELEKLVLIDSSTWMNLRRQIFQLKKQVWIQRVKGLR